ncbi:MAG: hypothetical protein ABI724_12720 [Betaproteobacteria bacterium]
MSQKAYVDFYETYLPSPAGADVVAKLKATKSEEEYGAIALKAGNAAGFDFTLDEAKAVMKNSQAKLERDGAAGELSEKQLDSAVGGATYSSSALVVNIGGSFASTSLAAKIGSKQMSTVMCPW